MDRNKFSNIPIIYVNFGVDVPLNKILRVGCIEYALSIFEIDVEVV